MRYAGADALEIADQLHRVYAEAFSGPPWNKWGAGIRQFRERLDRDVHRSGFRAVVAGSAPGIDGFATGWFTVPPFRTDRAYGLVTEQLGPRRVEEMLVGALEVDELAVMPHARRQGLGRRLLAALTADISDRRAWLLTARRVTETVAFYQRIGWHEVTPLPGCRDEIVVFLSPGHPRASG